MTPPPRKRTMIDKRGGAGLARVGGTLRMRISYSLCVWDRFRNLPAILATLCS